MLSSSESERALVFRLANGYVHRNLQHTRENWYIIGCWTSPSSASKSLAWTVKWKERSKIREGDDLNPKKINTFENKNKKKTGHAFCIVGLHSALNRLDSRSSMCCCCCCCCSFHGFTLNSTNTNNNNRAEAASTATSSTTKTKKKRTRKRSYRSKIYLIYCLTI